MGNKILIVDDNDVFRVEFKEYLEGRGYKTLLAANATEAMCILARPNDVGLILLDVKLPDVDGTEILPDIKKLSPDVRIIILTAYGSKDLAIEALRGRVDDYIEKPFNIDELKEMIERLLEKKEGYTDDVGDINSKIDKIKHFIKRNLHKKIKLEDAAEIVCLSPKYLSRVFRKIAGIGFSEYKRILTIEEAKDLLKTTGYTVNQISDKLGYRNAESFIRMFEKDTGSSPSVFRKIEAGNN